MKIAQLFGVKTNPSQQPRCCHQRNDGTECKANPRKGSQYCFFHDPAVEKERVAARRAGGVIRSRNAQANAQAIPVLAAYLLAKPMDESFGVREFLNEAASQFCQGKIDSRDANVLRHFALAVLRTLQFDERTERRAALAAAPRTFSGKKFPFPVQVNVKDIVTGELYQGPNRNGHSAAEPFSPPSRQDPKEDKPEQNRQQSISPASVASVQNETKAQTKDQAKAPQPAKAQPPAKAQHQNAQNKPQQDGQNKPQPNGQSAMSPAPPAAQPVAPAPQENPPVQYPPGLGPRYLSVATPEMPWWRRPQFGNPGFVTGTVPQTARMPAPAKRFRGTRR